MTTRPDPDKSPPAGKEEAQPVKGKSELFISEESAAQVANVTGPTDVDQDRKIREVKGEAPSEDKAEKWTGVSTSDP